jgi:hypothetical protein
MGQHRGLKQQGVDNIVHGVKSMLGFTILQKGVWAGHLQDDTTGSKEYMRGGIVEHTTIVTLDILDGAAKLCGNKGEKI